MLDPKISLLGDSFLSWLPAWSSAQLIALAIACLLVWLVVHLVWGKTQVPLRLGMGLLRVAAVAILILIVLGPTLVDEQPGAATRSDLMLLVDGSASMALGQEQSRWEECLSFVAQAKQRAGTSGSQNCPEYRFGHRLQPLHQSEPAEANGDETAIAAAQAEAAVNPPKASDSRLADAMRQMLSRIDPQSTEGVVLLSDGRVRNSESVEALAQHFGELSVPIHVVPVGQSQGTGDIAIVSLVTQTKVRKFTENEIQVFFRSFGYTGQRTTVRLKRKNPLSDSENVTLASVPVTLAGGPQSASLKYRIDVDPLDLTVAIDPLEGELADDNNRVHTHVDVDRTKVRVLYVEGSQMQQSLLGRVLPSVFGNPAEPRTVQLQTLREALQQDEDIECVTLFSSGGRSSPVGSGNLSTSMRAFPQARSELFAFDCIVLSNVSPSALEDTQLQRIAQWVDGRGGGLIVTGAGSLEARDWVDCPLEPIMPIQLASLRTTAPRQSAIQVVEDNHPIWKLSSQEHGNNALLSSIPELEVSIGELTPRPTVEILATADLEDKPPVLLSHRFGRGRVVVSTVDLGGESLNVLSSAWGSEASQNLGRFWRNMVYWATEGSSVGRRRLVAESDKRFYRPGDELNVLARAYDESARITGEYRIYAMFEPASLDDMSLYSPVLWPENVVRESGETGPRLAWGEELLLPHDGSQESTYRLQLSLSETAASGDSGMRIELTAYEGEETEFSFGHGTQVDSSSLEIQVLSDPFEQRNPLPNHELLQRVATLSGGSVLSQPGDLAAVMSARTELKEEPLRDLTPAWSRWWLWLAFVGLLTSEWIWRRLSGMA